MYICSPSPIEFDMLKLLYNTALIIIKNKRTATVRQVKQIQLTVF